VCQSIDANHITTTQPHLFFIDQLIPDRGDAESFTLALQCLYLNKLAKYGTDGRLITIDVSAEFKVT